MRALLAGIAVLAATALAVPVAGLAQSNAELCADHKRGVINCGPGNDRQVEGGGEKVPHDNGLNSKKGQRATRVWPKLSGILWQVVEDSTTPRTKRGGPLNDELLGHHGSDRLLGAGGHDILWGDWDPVRNNSTQRDVLSGGPGNDWLYPSHGPSIVRGGPGNDYVWDYYGKGSIDCGPGNDSPHASNSAMIASRSEESSPCTAPAPERWSSRRPASRRSYQRHGPPLGAPGSHRRGDAPSPRGSPDRSV